MTEGVSKEPTRARVLWRAFSGVAATIALLAYLFLVIVPAAHNPRTSGFAAYYTMSRVLLEHPSELAKAYDDAWFQSRIDAFGFVGIADKVGPQPPTMSLLLLPFAGLSPSAARVVWIACSVGFWVVAVGIASRVLFARTRTPHFVWVTLAVTAAYHPLRENFDHGQVYTLLLLLLMCTLVLLMSNDRRTSFLAGVPLGAMMVVKSAGLWLLLMLVVSRRWRPALGASLTYVGVALVSLPWLGIDSWVVSSRELVQLPTEPFRYVSAYQTVSGLLGHLFVFDATYNPHPLFVAPALALVATLLITAFAMVRSLRFARLPGSNSPKQLALKLAMFDALIVTLAPLAEGYHYVLVLPAVIVAVVWAIEEAESIPSRAVLAASLLLLTAPQDFYSDPRIQSGALAVCAYPRVYGALILWGWLGVVLGRASARFVSVSSPEPRAPSQV